MQKKSLSAFIALCLLICLFNNSNVKAATTNDSTKENYLDIIIDTKTNTQTVNYQNMKAITYTNTPCEWTNLKIVDYDPNQTFMYTQRIQYNAIWYTDSKGVKRFHQITDVESSISSYTDPLVFLKIREWDQDSYSVYFTDNNTVAHISVTGKMIYNLPIVAGEVGVEEPYSTETWNIRATFK